MALQPVEEVEIAGVASFRYVRQGSELWHRVHSGRITTGGLLAALGWRHEKAATQIGLHKNMRGNEYLKAAYVELLTGLEDVASISGTSTSSGSLPGAAGADTQAAAAAAVAGRNERRRSEFNASLQGAPPPSLDTNARRAICEQAALGGSLTVRLAFGKVQEAAALYALLRLFPDSVVEEVGIYTPDARQLPSSCWTGSPEALPPLGASPDGMLCHRLEFTSDEVRDAARKLQRGLREAAARDLLSVGLSRAACSAPAAAAAAGWDGDGTGPDGAAAGWDGDGTGLDGAAAGGSGSGAGGERRQHGPSPCGSLCDEPVEDRLVRFIETEAARLDAGAPSSAGGGTEGGSSSSSGGGGAGGGADADRDASGADASSCGSFGGFPHSLWIREVVEVKSHCPFVMRGKRRGRKGQIVADYGMNSCAPASRVHASWVPQLQMHMLCTGCMTALLVSRTPNNGLRVFRMWRDDSYLALMLSVLSALLTQHVATGRAPVGSQFLALPGQSRLLSQTNEIARRAAVISEPGCPGAAANWSAAEASDGGAGAAAVSGGLKVTLSGGGGAVGGGVGGGGGGSDGFSGLLPPASSDGSNVSAFWV